MRSTSQYDSVMKMVTHILNVPLESQFLQKNEIPLNLSDVLHTYNITAKINTAIEQKIKLSSPQTFKYPIFHQYNRCEE